MRQPQHVISSWTLRSFELLVGGPALVLPDRIAIYDRRADQNDVGLRLLALEDLVANLDSLGADVERRLRRGADEVALRILQCPFRFRRAVDAGDRYLAPELLGSEIGAHRHLVVDREDALNVREAREQGL